MAQSARQICEICMSARGSEYCLDCSQYFCTGCKATHLRIAVCKNHTFKDTIKAENDSTVFCQDHSEVFTFICDTCELPVCKKCIIRTHKGHTLSDIEETVEKKKSELQTSFHSILNAGVIKKVEKLDTKIAECEAKLDRDTEAAIGGVKSDGEVLKKSVDSAVENMIKCIQDRSNEEKVQLKRTKTKSNDVKMFTQSLTEKEEEIRKSRGSIKLLHEMGKLEGYFRRISVPSFSKPPTIRYTAMNQKEGHQSVQRMLGELEFIRNENSIDEKCVLSGEVFENILSHGSTFRNEISILANKIKDIPDSNDEKCLILFYKSQMMNDFNSEFVQKVVKIYFEKNNQWQNVVLQSIEELNKAAPGLLIQISNDRNIADIVIAKNSYSSANTIWWEESYEGFVAVLNFAEKSEVPSDSCQGVATFQLLYALGFHREMLRLYCTLASISPASSEQEIKTISRFDPYSILLWCYLRKFPSDSSKYQVILCEQTTASELSELDKVGLNLLFPPCETKSYKPLLSRKTKILYCGRRVMADHNRPNKSRTDGRCGPGDGANCPTCRTIIEPIERKMNYLLSKGKFQGWSGQVYCGKKIKALDVCCGPSYGTPCPSCMSELI